MVEWGDRGMRSDVGGIGGRRLTRRLGEGRKSALNEGLLLGASSRAQGSFALVSLQDRLFFTVDYSPAHRAFMGPGGRNDRP